jgi:hypothetical protein
MFRTDSGMVGCSAPTAAEADERRPADDQKRSRAVHLPGLSGIFQLGRSCVDRLLMSCVFGQSIVHRRLGTSVRVSRSRKGRGGPARCALIQKRP